MPVTKLGERGDFPAVERAGRGGLLAFGGDLSPRRLLRAYGRGIFPWYEEGQPILWWSPAPRCVLFGLNRQQGENRQDADDGQRSFFHGDVPPERIK